jgi:hypothetical protein
LDEKGIPTGSIPLPEDARAGFESDEPFTYTIKDKDGNVYTITKDKYKFVTKEKHKFNPYGIKKNEQSYKRLSWSENPFNRYDIRYKTD